jgi:cobalt/nickel transport system permease protein
MSHIHLPDGVLPVWLWVLGYIVIGVYLIFLTLYVRKHSMDKKIALVGMMSALMITAMSIEIIPPAYHTNLAVLSGIVLGPIFSVLAVLVSNIFLALIGHGGVSVIGINTIVVSIEALAGFWLFKLLSSGIKNIFVSVFITTVLALFISAWASIGVIYVGTNDVTQAFTEHEYQHERVLSQQNEISTEVLSGNKLDFRRLIVAVLALGLLGWIIEGLITAFVVVYIKRIKPDLIEI